MQVDLPALTREQLETYVTAVVTGFDPAARVAPGDLDHLAVNTLRHRHTDYDTTQSTEAFLAAGEAIAAAYPHLAVAVAAQVADRVAHDAVFGVAPGRHAGRSPAQVQAWREQRRADSVLELARRRLTVGEQVRFLRYGREHTGVVESARPGGASVRVRVAPAGGEHEVVTTVHGVDLTG